MARKKVALLPSTEHALEKVGSNIKRARLRRNIRAELLAERAGISADTLTSIEKGVCIVSIGAYAAVLFSLGMEKDLELLDSENNSLWSNVLYGVYAADDQIVAVAASQLGNVGGQPYWSWYGFGSRVEWCACFVSWCANECGYIDVGVIPKFALCSWGAQWGDNTMEPAAGTIIFFDWDGDNDPDHEGIVEYTENGVVHTIEGNSGDTCRQRQYSVENGQIYGYGLPAY